MKGPKVLGVSGVKNSGKTSLIGKLAPLLKASGLKVSVVKHDGHSYHPEVTGTDTEVFYQAGVDGYAIFDGEKFSLTKKRKITEREIFPFFQDSDLIIIEGLKDSDYPKLELIRQINGRETVCKRETVLAYITDFNMETDKPVFHLDNLEEIKDFVLEVLEYD